MAKESMMQLHCIGCGALIQSQDEKKAGFLPQSALDTAKDIEQLYCKRCFRLRHYNEIADVEMQEEDFLRLLTAIGRTNSLVVNVVDIFDFNGSMISGLKRFVNNDILLVANKRDVLPKAIKDQKIINWLSKQVADYGLKPLDIQLVSAFNPERIEALMQTIEAYRKGRDVYVVGVTNVGKSTLVNAIIKQATGQGNVITTSRFPGTTLDRVEIPLGDENLLIDTPGIIHHEQMAHVIGKKDLKLVSPQKEIKPLTYQLNAGQTLFLGGLARFDYIQGDKQGIGAYFARELKVHRSKLEGADAFYAKHLGGLLTPPRTDEIAEFPALVRREFAIEAKTDLVFSGLGWIRIAKPGLVAAWVPEGVSVVLRDALI